MSTLTISIQCCTEGPTQCNQASKRNKDFSSGQDGGVGRHTVPPCTTKRRTTTNLKIKNNQNCQKNQTAWKSNNQGDKEETFIQTRWRGLAARQQLEDQARRRLADWVVSHLCADKPGGTIGSETDHATQGPSMGK